MADNEGAHKWFRDPGDDAVATRTIRNASAGSKAGDRQRPDQRERIPLGTAGSVRGCALRSIASGSDLRLEYPAGCQRLVGLWRRAGEALGRQVCIELTQEDRGMVRETNAATKADQEMEAVKDHIEALRSDLATLTTHIKGLSSATLEQAQSAGALKFEELSADLQRAADAIRQQGQASIAQFENMVREKPLISLLAAFGAGVLFARLLERR
jgi:ElaB/YqjD/DUF883 family membrane-anchored ribosome-binding protein